MKIPLNIVEATLRLVMPVVNCQRTQVLKQKRNAKRTQSAKTKDYDVPFCNDKSPLK